MNTLQFNIQKISEMRNLPDNWNQNGSSRFSAKILNTSRQIIEHLNDQPRISPTARDSVQFEYENGSGDYLEFELFEDGKLKKFFYSHDGKSETKYIPIESVGKEVTKFYER